MKLARRCFLRYAGWFLWLVLGAVHAAFAARGIEPGSDAALRLFS